MVNAKEEGLLTGTTIPAVALAVGEVAGTGTASMMWVPSGIAVGVDSSSQPIRLALLPSCTPPLVPLPLPLAPSLPFVLEKFCLDVLMCCSADEKFVWTAQPKHSNHVELQH